ncbi:MAG: response regulator, partial [Oscillospiraceae bacterium]
AEKKKWEKTDKYDIILLDWKMPDMDGIDTARAIRKVVGPEVTIIIMTAYDWAAIEIEAKQAGVNMLISKPLFKSSLCTAFEKIYNEKNYELKSTAKVEYDFSGKRVLLVEDHLLNIEVAKKMLTGKNFQVDVAENGLRAIETFAQASEGYYDLILMDIRMPVMDGLTAAKAIRQMRKSDAKTIPIIAMTANAFEEDIEKTKAAGMNAHLAKPIEPQLLYQTMENFLNKEVG